MTLRKPFLYAFAITLGFLGASGVIAWTGPSQGAPNGNASAPLNVSSTGQTKVGGLRVNSGGAATGLEVVSGTTLLASDLIFTQGASTRNVGVVGTYDPTKLAAIWSMGPAYKLGGAGTAGNLYGLNYSYEPNYGAAGNNPGAVAGLGHQMQWRANGVTQTAIGTGIYTIGSISDTAGVRMDAGGGWLRTYGATGWYNGTYGGGFYMTSAQAITTYNSSSVTASAFYYSSDERLKKNIEAIANSKALQDILALKPVTYNWIDEGRGTDTELGFIAQQVEAIAPELVTTDPSTGMKAVDYPRVTPLLVGALQAQQEQIDALRAEIDALKARK